MKAPFQIPDFEKNVLNRLKTKSKKPSIEDLQKEMKNLKTEIKDLKTKVNILEEKISQKMTLSEEYEADESEHESKKK